MVIRDWPDEALALLDTGFTGELIIPESVLSQDLGAPDEHTDVELGDNSIVDAPIYLGTLEIIGFPPIPDVAVIVLGPYCPRQDPGAICTATTDTVQNSSRILIRYPSFWCRQDCPCASVPPKGFLCYSWPSESVTVNVFGGWSPIAHF